MMFNDLAFPYFFALFLLFTLISRGRVRLIGFTLLSYMFYAVSGPAFVLLLVFSTILDYNLARGIAWLETPWKRKTLLVISLTINILVLAVFKYAGFVSEQLNILFKTLGINWTLGYLDVPLPVGISFYTFQSISYIVDIYRRKSAPPESVLDFAFCIAFFAHLVAGPIVRPSEFLPQLKTYRPLVVSETLCGLEFILVGLFKKVIVADHIATELTWVFIHPYQYSPANLALASVLFAIQIYCDFSGYTDVARGIARILGFSFPLNFQWPYFSATMQEFWRRWHMTLSFWIRDYVYIPLGGSRVSPVRRWFNVTLTWFLCGLWHGAAWKYIVWGLYNGAWVEATRHLDPPANRLRRVPYILATFALTCLGWLIFRASNLATGACMVLRCLGADFFLRKETTSFLGVPYIHMHFFTGFPFTGMSLLWVVLLLACLHALTRLRNYQLDGEAVLARMPHVRFVVVTSVIILFLLCFRGPNQPFIYFAF